MKAYTFSATQYVRKAVANVQEFMNDLGYKFTSKAINVPIPTNYHPELDGLCELEDGLANFYQSIIGVL